MVQPQPFLATTGHKNPDSGNGDLPPESVRGHPRVNLPCLTLPNGPAKLSRDIAILQRDFSTLLHQWWLAG